MRIRVLGAHNSVSKGSGYVSLLLDGIIALDAGSLASGLNFPEQRAVKAVLLTHAHYDHLRDIPAFGLNLFQQGVSCDIYSPAEVNRLLASHLLDGELYPRFTERPPGKPTFTLHDIAVGEPTDILGYSVLPLAVAHGVPAVGYEIVAPDGNRFFYSGDTGVGLADNLDRIEPRLLVVETSLPDRYEDLARGKGHLTPHLLETELTAFRKMHRYLPLVYLVHMNPEMEDEIRRETGLVAGRLEAQIELAAEGMGINF